MVENRPIADFVAHAVLILGVILVAFPLWVTFVASTLTYDEIIAVPMPLIPGDQMIENYGQVLRAGSHKGSAAPVSTQSCSAAAPRSVAWPRWPLTRDSTCSGCRRSASGRSRPEPQPLPAFAT